MRPTTRMRGWMRQEALWVVVIAAIASNLSALAQKLPGFGITLVSAVVAHTAGVTAANNMDALKATLTEYDTDNDFRYVSHHMTGRGGKMHKVHIYYKRSGGRDFSIDCVFKTPAAVEARLGSTQKRKRSTPRQQTK